MIILLIINLITGIFGYHIGASKGQAGMGFCLGFCLGIIGLLILCCLPNNKYKNYPTTVIHHHYIHHEHELPEGLEMLNDYELPVLPPPRLNKLR